MPIIIEKTPLDETNEDFRRRLLNKEIHLVCEAANGLTALNAFACQVCEIDFKIIDEAVALVNNKKETGTLYPRASISIIPIERVLNNNYDQAGLNTPALQKCLEDVLVANEKYIHAKLIYFSLETFADRHLLIKNILRNLLDNQFNNPTYLEEIHFFA